MVYGQTALLVPVFQDAPSAAGLSTALATLYFLLRCGQIVQSYHASHKLWGAPAVCCQSPAWPSSLFQSELRHLCAQVSARGVQAECKP